MPLIRNGPGIIGPLPSHSFLRICFWQYLKIQFRNSMSSLRYRCKWFSVTETFDIIFLCMQFNFRLVSAPNMCTLNNILVLTRGVCHSSAQSASYIPTYQVYLGETNGTKLYIHPCRYEFYHRLKFTIIIWGTCMKLYICHLRYLSAIGIYSYIANALSRDCMHACKPNARLYFENKCLQRNVVI